MGTLKTLNLEKSLWEQNVGDLSKLVLLGIKSFGWDKINKGPAMQVRINAKLLLNIILIIICS